METYTQPLRPWHWLRPNDSTGTPKVVSAVAVLTRVLSVEGNRRVHGLRSWGLLSVDRRRKKPRQDFVAGRDAAEFWQQLSTVRRRRASHWLMGWHLGRAMTWLNFWDETDACRIQIHGEHEKQNPAVRRPWWWKPGWAGALITEGKPFWVKCRWAPGVLNLADVRNYAEEPIHKFAGAAGVTLPERPDEHAGAVADRDYLQAVTETILRWTIFQLGKWDGENCGNWRPTGSGLAWNAFRHKFLSERGVQIHSHPEALELERRAVAGGRCIVFYQGKIRAGRPSARRRSPGRSPVVIGPPAGPVFRFDTNSLYAAVMAAHPYPCRLLSLREGCKLEEIAALCRRYCLVADCLVESEDRPYAVRKGAVVKWRVGNFWTTLTTPEILHALKRSRLRQIGQVAYYQPARLFEKWAEWAYQKKAGPGIAKGSADEAFGKLLLVGLYGKWLQSRRGWYDLPDRNGRGVWATFYGTDAGGKSPWAMRSLGHAVQCFHRGGETLDSFPAIGAHILAYARLEADRWFDQLPAGSLLYHDTDSYLVTETGRAAIAGYPARIGAELGQLRVDGPYGEGEIFGMKHYRLGREWVTGSLPQDSQPAGRGRFRYTVMEDVDGLLHRATVVTHGNPGGVMTEQTRTAKIGAMPCGRIVGPTGWTEPVPFEMPPAETIQIQEESLPSTWVWEGQLQSRHPRAQRSRAS